MKKTLIISLTLILLFSKLNAQIYQKPIAGKQSHPELEITKVEINDQETIISLIITNKLSEGGWFCADQDIYIKNSKGPEIYELIKSENIPTCPETYDFSYANETLAFKLYFLPIPNEIRFIDLIEDCHNSCFSFQGIILNNKHNENIRAFEKGFELYQNNNKQEAIPFFERVAENTTTLDSHIYGLSYYYLILIYQELNKPERVTYWYDILINSNIDDKNTFIHELEKSDIKK